MMAPPTECRRWWSACLVCLAAFIVGAYGDCGPPPQLNNTLIREGAPKDSYEVGSLVTYMCDYERGYQQSHGMFSTIHCKLDSTWSEIPVFCERSCSLPPRLYTGRMMDTFISVNVFPAGFTVTYQCRTGFTLIPKPNLTRTVTCLDTYEWTEIKDFCEGRDCGNPGEIVNGHVAFEFGDDGQISTKFGSSVTFVCNTGFRIVGRNKRVCTNKGWSNAVPSCDTVICPKPPDIPNGTHSSMGQEEFPYQSGVTYRCNSKSLSLIGEPLIFCTEDTNWSGPAPKCKEVRCTDPHVPNANRISGFGVSHTFQDVVGLECKAGFVMKGNSLIMCGEDNEWHPSLPMCRFMTCGSPPEIADGAHNGTGSYVHGTSVTYHCNSEEFMLTGISWIHCRMDGTWSQQAPTCRAVIPSVNCDIESIPPIPHGELVAVGKDNSFEFRCDTLYVLHGEKRLYCIGERSWNMPFPECHLSKVYLIVIIFVSLIVVIAVAVSLFYWNSKKKQGHYPTNEKGGSKAECIQLRNSDSAVKA